MKKALSLSICSLLAVFAISDAALATEVAFDLAVHGASKHNFDEFKVEGNRSGGEKATGHIENDGVYNFKYTFDTQNNDRIWVWIDTLRAPADLTIKVDNIPVFHGYCVPDASRLSGERNIFDACAANQSARTAHDGVPYFWMKQGSDSYFIFK